ncbi:hypothetical protein BDF20DRAFT_800004, partial [Mycotypha africana]|uniref:uncharacterized protein n=1 Tax=Mycotypha africana TaxID=64632 RepID=UPI002301CF92
MRLNYFTRDGILWQCPSERCSCRPGRSRRRRSLRDHSFFNYLKAPLDEFLLVVYHFLLKTPVSSIKMASGLHHNTIQNIIDSIYHLMELDLKREDQLIGGLDENNEPIIVEIDESKFGKRKYHRGHHVEGIWVVGGNEKTPQRKAFLTIVQDRTANTFEELI